MVVIPHLSLLEDAICPAEPEYWLRVTLDMLRKCDAVFRLPGFSTGSDGEEAEAGILGIPVFRSRDSLAEWVKHFQDGTIPGTISDK